MLYINKTNKGKITFDKNIIANIVIREVKNRSKYFYLANSKGKFVKAKNGEFLKIEYYIKKDQPVDVQVPIIDVKIYLIIKFGISIKAHTQSLLKKIKTDIQEISGLTVNKLTIVIVGVKANNKSPRHIEVSL